MADDEKTTLFKDQLRKGKHRFDASMFRAMREMWQRIKDRRETPPLSDEIIKWAGNIDIQTPEVERAFGDHVKILCIGSTEVNAVCLENNNDAREDVEDISLWHKAWQKQLNEGGQVSHIMSEGQTGVGVQILRILWNMPTTKEWPERNPDEPIHKWASRSIKARDDYYNLASKQTWQLVTVDPLQCYWGPTLDDPDNFFHECEVPFWEYRTLKSDSGKYPSLDAAAKKVVWLGDPMPYEASPYSEAPTIHVVYHAYRVPGTNDWKMCEYLFGSGGTLIEDGEKLHEYDVPGHMCPFIIVPAGDEVKTQSDPHLRYRTRMYPLYCLAGEYNSTLTLLAALAIKESSDRQLYINPGNSITQEALNVLEEAGVTFRDALGQNRRAVIDDPEFAYNEMPLLPRMYRRPESNKEALIIRLEQLREDIRQALPNRFITGRAYEETREGTGTAVTNQTQAASFSYDFDLEEQRKAWRRIHTFIDNCVLSWGEGKDYYLPMSESLLEESPDAKTNVYVNAEKLSRNYELVVRITNETQQEKQARWEQADRDFSIGRLTPEKWLQARDDPTPLKTLHEMNQQRLRMKYAQRLDGIVQQAIDVALSALSGLNLPESIGAAQQQPMPAGPSPLPPPSQPNSMISGDTRGQGDRVAPSPQPTY